MKHLLIGSLLFSFVAIAADKPEVKCTLTRKADDGKPATVKELPFRKLGEDQFRFELEAEGFQFRANVVETDDVTISLEAENKKTEDRHFARGLRGVTRLELSTKADVYYTLRCK